MENPVEQNGEQNVEKIGTSSSSYVCRQSSTRWTPTTEQIKMLKELYYINGVRSPTADQIQAICSRLRRYGKIEGKNVFYWFQNHKARERQKKRLTPTSININNNINCWKQDDFTKYPTSSTCINNNNFTTTTTTTNNNNNNNNNNINNINNNNNNPGISCSSSSAGMVSAAGGGGQLMGSFGYGAVTMENKFRDCSISGGFNTTPQWTSPAAATGGTTNYNTTTYASFPNFHDKLSATFDEDHEQDHYVVTTEIETLPLFPMHDKDNDHNNNNNNNNNQFSRDHQFPSSAGFYTGGYCWSNGGGNGASLELTLNSYGYGCYSHNY